MAEIRCIGIGTGGGDAPGLNAVIRAATKAAIIKYGWKVIGIPDGFDGLIWPDKAFELTLKEVSGILPRGGTILGTTNRGDPFHYKTVENGKEVSRDISGEVIANAVKLGIDAIITIGGDGSQKIGYELFQKGLKIVGVPKTIDNDLMVTDFSFGFDTAVNIVTEAVDRLRTTTESHRRIMVVETMGRHSGWIACFAGIAAGADYILVPEVPIDLPHLIGVLSKRRAGGKKYGIVIVAEGAKFPDRGPLTLGDHPDPFGNPRLGGIGAVIAEAIERQTGLETRCVVLGHLQRGGPPSAYDRILATRLGLAASRLVLQNRFGTMVTLARGKIVESVLSGSSVATKTLDLTYYDEAAAFFH